jgi:uncharacterized membrane protein YecN with MAPEG domain
MMSIRIAIVAVTAALNGLLILVLAYLVGHHRGRLGALEPGATGDTTLTRAIRAHGNASEYIPTALILMLLLAAGMMRDTHPNAIRFTGNLLTGVVYLVASCAALYYALP